MPVNVVPADGAVNRTVRPVFKVTVNVFPLLTVSLAVAVTLTVCPALYAPSAVVVENDEIVGAVVSIARLLVSEIFAPDGRLMETIALPAPSATVLIE